MSMKSKYKNEQRDRYDAEQVYSSSRLARGHDHVFLVPLRVVPIQWQLQNGPFVAENREGQGALRRAILAGVDRIRDVVNGLQKIETHAQVIRLNLVLGIEDEKIISVRGHSEKKKKRVNK